MRCGEEGLRRHAANLPTFRLTIRLFPPSLYTTRDNLVDDMWLVMAGLVMHPPQRLVSCDDQPRVPDLVPTLSPLEQIWAAPFLVLGTSLKLPNRRNGLPCIGIASSSRSGYFWATDSFEKLFQPNTLLL